MGTLTLVLGGISSGKSAFGESLGARWGGPVLYVATGRATDPEMEVRIEKHRARRPSHWRTLEIDDLDPLFEMSVEPQSAVLLDSVSAWVANFVCNQEEASSRGGGGSKTRPIAAKLQDNLVRLLDWAPRQSGALILVSDEVGLSLVSPNPAGRLFQELLGKANQVLAAAADEVFLVTAGIPLQIKPATGSPHSAGRR